MLYPNKQYTNDFVIGAHGTHDPLGTANFDSSLTVVLMKMLVKVSMYYIET